MTPSQSQGVTARTNTHYDRDPRLFELFLDRSLKYSSGLYADGARDLDSAQEAKLKYVGECLGVRPGMRLLDIGCGWGSLVLHFASRYGCNVVGVTPAARQAELIRHRADRLGVSDRVEIRVGAFDDVDLEPGSFDGLTMLGSLIHFPDKEAAVARCYKLCARRARVYFSESCFRSASVKRAFDSRPGTIFVREDIFGWGEIIPLSSYLQLFEEAGFSLAGARDLTRDYAKTIDAWSENVRANAAELEQVEAGSVERLLRYFATANAGWGFTTKHYALSFDRSR
jgi:cyclopropane-fatty-acyl-phospholipid synthase